MSYHDYVPFGDEIPSGVNSRSATLYASADGVNKKFTGQYRDTETQSSAMPSGLDFFGARYFSAAQGRFTSPDWSEAPEPIPYADLSDPQTLNLYAYVRNNPLLKADIDGHCSGDDCSKVTVQAEVSQKPRVVQNQPVTLPNGQTVKVTKVEGKIEFTVKKNGQAVAGAKVTETNQNSDTRNGQPVRSTVVEGKASTNKTGTA